MTGDAQGAKPGGGPIVSAAVLALVGGALAFSLMTVCVRQLRGQLPAAEVVLGRSVVSLALSALLVQRAGLNPWGQRRGLLAVRGLVGSAALLCVFEAVMALPLATATVLQYLYPTLTALLAWPWLGERPAGRIGAALLLGWLGVVAISQPWALAAGMTSRSAAIGITWALAGALLTAVAYVSVRDLARSEHSLVIVLWFPLMALPVSLPLLLWNPVLPTPAGFGWLLGVGLFTQLGQIGITEGLRRLPAAQATLVSSVQVAFAALWGLLVFGEPLTLPTAAGALLILLSLVVALSARGRTAQPPPLR